MHVPRRYILEDNNLNTQSYENLTSHECISVIICESNYRLETLFLCPYLLRSTEIKSFTDPEANHLNAVLLKTGPQ
jgi:hypothetical protein